LIIFNCLFFDIIFMNFSALKRVSPSSRAGLSFGKDKAMNTLKSVSAAAVMALSATVSAQVVHVPDFPVKKAAPAQVAAADSKAPASAQGTVKSEKAA
jgi:hypothetical protein